MLLFLILLIIQFGLWSHATHIAQAAASGGLAAARVYDGTAADGTSAAKDVLAKLGDGPLRRTRVAATRTANTAAVRVDGSTSTVIPFIEISVHATASGPVERVTEALCGFTNSETVSGGNLRVGGAP